MASAVVTYQANGYIAGLMSGADTKKPTHIGWARGPVTISRSSTDLPNEDSGGSPAYARKSASVSRMTTSHANDTVIASGAIKANANKTIYGAGLFAGSTGSNAWALASFDPIAVSQDAEITFTWRIQIK